MLLNGAKNPLLVLQVFHILRTLNRFLLFSAGTLGEDVQVIVELAQQHLQICFANFLRIALFLCQGISASCVLNLCDVGPSQRIYLETYGLFCYGYRY